MKFYIKSLLLLTLFLSFTSCAQDINIPKPNTSIAKFKTTAEKFELTGYFPLAVEGFKLASEGKFIDAVEKFRTESSVGSDAVGNAFKALADAFEQYTKPAFIIAIKTFETAIKDAEAWGEPKVVEAFRAGIDVLTAKADELK